MGDFQVNAFFSPTSIVATSQLLANQHDACQQSYSFIPDSGDGSTGSESESPASSSEELTAGQSRPASATVPPSSRASTSAVSTAPRKCAETRPPEGMKPRTDSFLWKLWNYLASTPDSPILYWSTSGRFLIIANEQALINEILVVLWKQKDYSSFARQLNIYGFKRVNTVRAKDEIDDDITEGLKVWKHEFLTRDSPAADLFKIRRRATAKKTHPKRKADANNTRRQTAPSITAKGGPPPVPASNPALISARPSSNPPNHTAPAQSHSSQPYLTATPNDQYFRYVPPATTPSSVSARSAPASSPYSFPQGYHPHHVSAAPSATTYFTYPFAGNPTASGMVAYGQPQPHRSLSQPQFSYPIYPSQPLQRFDSIDDERWGAYPPAISGNKPPLAVVTSNRLPQAYYGTLAPHNQKSSPLDSDQERRSDASGSGSGTSPQSGSPAGNSTPSSIFTPRFHDTTLMPDVSTTTDGRGSGKALPNVGCTSFHGSQVNPAYYSMGSSSLDSSPNSSPTDPLSLASTPEFSSGQLFSMPPQNGSADYSAQSNRHSAGQNGRALSNSHSQPLGFVSSSGSNI